MKYYFLQEIGIVIVIETFFVRSFKLHSFAIIKFLVHQIYFEYSLSIEIKKTKNNVRKHSGLQIIDRLKPGKYGLTWG